MGIFSHISDPLHNEVIDPVDSLNRVQECRAVMIVLVWVQTVNGLAKIRVAPFNNTMLQVCHRAKSSYKVVIDILNGRVWHQKEVLKFHNDTVNSFGVMGKGNAIFQPYFHVTMSYFNFSYFLNSCPHKIKVLEQFINFWLHSKYGFI